MIVELTRNPFLVRRAMQHVCKMARAAYLRYVVYFPIRDAMHVSWRARCFVEHSTQGSNG